MSSDVAVISNQAEQVLIAGDLSKLTTDDRVKYYHAVCQSVGLNPLTQPFDYITLNGKLRLYAKRDATDQLRKLHGVSIEKVERELVGDVYVVTAHARDKAGRVDSEIGAVNVAGLKGEALANAYMKATTKAKRRVTLSICGMGFLDESEVEDIPGTRHAPVEVKQLPPPAKEEKPAPPAKQPANGTKPPLTVTEYLAGVKALQAKMAADGLCGPGELQARIDDWAHERELPLNPLDWKPEDLAAAGKEARKFQQEMAKRATQPA